MNLQVGWKYKIYNKTTCIYTHPVFLSYKCYTPNLVKIGPVVLEKKMLIDDSRRTTDDARRLTPAHSNTSPECLGSSSDGEPGVFDGSVITCFLLCVRNFPIEQVRFLDLTCSNLAGINNNNFELFTYAWRDRWWIFCPL